MQYDTAYFDSEEFQELFHSFETAEANGEHPFLDADDLVDIADYYNYNGNYDKAVSVVDYALDLYPNATLPNVFKAREALVEGNFAEARRYAGAIEETDDPDYHYLVAEILIAEQHLDEAARYLHDYSLTVEADEYEDFLCDCADLYMYYGQYKEVQQYYNELLDRDPYSTTWWNALASAQYLNEQFGDAVTSSEYALAINPKDSEALAIKGSALIQLGNIEEAVIFLRRYVEIVPDDYPFMAACCYELDYPEEFLYYLQIACQYDPEGTRQALGRLFPEDMEVGDYYQYMVEQLNQVKN